MQPRLFARARRLQTLEPQPEPKPAAIASTIPSPTSTVTVVAPTQIQGHSHVAFQDPAIVSMGRRPTIQTAHPHVAPSSAVQATAIANPADTLSFSSLNETDTTDTTILHPPDISQLTIQTSSKPPTAPATAPATDTTEDDLQDLTPTAATARSGFAPRRRGKRGKRQQGTKKVDEGTPASSARPTNQSTGWRETPILQSTKSFQPFASLKKNQKRRADPGADSGLGLRGRHKILAKFDKRTIFVTRCGRQDLIDEADRLVSHNRIPRPKPGTAGGKNLHYTENVLDTTPSSSKVPKETPGDFWRSEADDDVVLNGGGETPSGREGSGRNSRLRGESRMSTTRRSQSRKASATAIPAEPVAQILE
ncbi:hypothetical protein NUW58_g8240 [Xylaria curta]|uniref:Uncharacterized protein n=1 Tax=Xylaria curta TaxID=42375 RepID=A0ACC1NA32_9PEZI|nr:hypothetical protein NUW58_g8240 [Xylaria curta]